MSSDIKTTLPHTGEVEAKPNYGQDVEQVEHVTGKSDAAVFKAEAMEAEGAEFQMTVLQAAKAYPMACFWAFVMSFCIVSDVKVSEIS
jgi:SP family general alpha glucoside:H+ symporter-like MFS transporter